MPTFVLALALTFVGLGFLLRSLGLSLLGCLILAARPPFDWEGRLRAWSKSRLTRLAKALSVRAPVRRKAFLPSLLCLSTAATLGILAVGADKPQETALSWMVVGCLVAAQAFLLQLICGLPLDDLAARWEAIPLLQRYTLVAGAAMIWAFILPLVAS